MMTRPEGYPWIGLPEISALASCLLIPIIGAHGARFATRPFELSRWRGGRGSVGDGDVHFGNRDGSSRLRRSRCSGELTPMVLKYDLASFRLSPLAPPRRSASAN